MARKKPIVNIRSYGIYTKWHEDSKELPKIQEFTRRFPAEIDIEFGFVANIKHAKNEQVRYCIYHANIPDDRGVPRPPFDGEVYVRTNDWDFFLGDTIWAPIHDKRGTWRMTLEIDSLLVADESFEVE